MFLLRSEIWVNGVPIVNPTTNPTGDGWTTILHSDDQVNYVYAVNAWTARQLNAGFTVGAACSSERSDSLSVYANSRLAVIRIGGTLDGYVPG